MSTGWMLALGAAPVALLVLAAAARALRRRRRSRRPGGGRIAADAYLRLKRSGDPDRAAGETVA